MCNFTLQNHRRCRRRRTHALSTLGYCTYHYNRHERDGGNGNNAQRNNNQRRRRQRRVVNIQQEQQEQLEQPELQEEHIPNLVEHDDDEKKCEDCYQKCFQGCSICLEPINCSKNHYITECIHHYHEACFQRWYRMNKTCPLCRQKHIGYDRPIYNKLTIRQYRNLETTILKLNMDDVLQLLQNADIRKKLFLN